MTTPKSLYATTYHRDGTVTIWDCYAQQWRRLSAAGLVAVAAQDNSIMSTLPESERRRIRRMARRMKLAACQRGKSWLRRARS